MPALYAHPASTMTELPRPVARLSANEAASAATSATTAVTATARRLTWPVTIGLSVRPAAASRGASNASFDQPMLSCPASTAKPSSHRSPERAPALTASSTTSAVMARQAPGWLARTNAPIDLTIATPEDARGSRRPGQRTDIERTDAERTDAEREVMEHVAGPAR